MGELAEDKDLLTATGMTSTCWRRRSYKRTHERHDSKPYAREMFSGGGVPFSAAQSQAKGNGRRDRARTPRVAQPQLESHSARTPETCPRSAARSPFPVTLLILASRR